MGCKTSLAILGCFFSHLILTAAMPVPTNNKKTWQKFKNDFKSPGLKIVWDKTSSVPRIIMGTKVAPSKKIKQKMNERTIPPIIFDFLKKYEGLLQVPGKDVKITSIKQFQNKWYIKAQIYYKGIPIFRCQMGFVLDQMGNILSYGSDCNPNMKIKTCPAISQTKAVQIAHRHHQPGVNLRVKLKEIFLMIYLEKLPRKTGKYRLAWYVSLGGETGDLQQDRVFFIDALTGEKIDDFSPYPSNL